MMRILQVVPHYVPAYRFGGPLIVAHSLGKALVRAGHRVVVCTTNLADEKNDLDVPLDIQVKRDGVSVYYESTYLFRMRGFSPALWRRIVKEISVADVVFVHAHFQFANWAGAWLARRAKKPYVIFAHGSLHREGIAHKNKFLKRVYLRILEHGNMRNAAFIAFNAPEEKDHSFYGELGKVVRNGIDPAEFLNMPPKGSFRERYSQLRGKIIFLFLGRLDVQHKGLDLLLEAFARLARECRNVHLVLAGPDEGGGVARINLLAQQYGVNDSVTLTGLISGQDKLAALQGADAFVLPSRFEGLSIAILEALYVGLPMLVTDQVGLCDEIRRIGAGLVVPVRSESIYYGLLKLAQERTRASMRGRGIELIEREYSWDAIARDLVEQIQEMVGLGCRILN